MSDVLASNEVEMERQHQQAYPMKINAFFLLFFRSVLLFLSPNCHSITPALSLRIPAYNKLKQRRLCVFGYHQTNPQRHPIIINLFFFLLQMFGTTNNKRNHIKYRYRKSIYSLSSRVFRLLLT